MRSDEFYTVVSIFSIDDVRYRTLTNKMGDIFILPSPLPDYSVVRIADEKYMLTAIDDDISELEKMGLGDWLDSIEGHRLCFEGPVGQSGDAEFEDRAQGPAVTPTLKAN